LAVHRHVDTFGGEGEAHPGKGKHHKKHGK
jgi:hypothetical protein